MKIKNQYVIGVDGGGTKTVVALADLNGEILKRVKTGPTNPNKVGLKRAIFNLKQAILVLTRNCSKGKISLAYFGLAGGLERDEKKRKKIEEILKREFSFPIKVEGDQKIAFRAAVSSKNGVLIISGTGSISMGWRGARKEISGGWDWLLGDQGSAFWVGKTALEKAIEFFDGRTRKFSKSQKMIFEKWNIQKEKDLYQKFYHPDFVERISSISKIVDLLAEKGDREAREILKMAGKELAKMGTSVIRKLKLQKEKFPLVFSGSMFKSKIVLEETKKEIKKFALKAKFISLKKEPVIGAIKLAIEEIKNKGNV